MKTSLKKHLAWAPFVTLLIGVAVFTGLTRASAQDDPFAAMYDSDAVFLTEVDQILQMEQDMAVSPAATAGYLPAFGDIAPGVDAMPANSLNTSAKIARNAALRQTDRQQVLAAVRDNRLDRLSSDLSLSDESRDMIERAYEASRVDRFIVKYRDSRTSRSVEDVASDSIAKSYNLSAESAPSAKGRIFDAVGAGVTPGRLECVVLNEKVNPADFAAELKAAGMAADIEYMQPDYLLSYSSLNLDYSEVDTGGEEIDAGNNEPAVDEGGAIEEEPAEPSGDLNNGDSEGNTLDEDAPTEQELQEEYQEEEALVEEELLPEEGAQQEIVVGLIDTGVDIWHPAIRDSIVDGWNFVDNSNNVYDASQPLQSAHGTHIAGIIAQNSDEYVKIMPLQVFGEQGAYTSDIIAAIQYAEEHGVKIVNCSFGSSEYNQALEEAIANSNMLFVAAVGNTRSDLAQAPVYPAAFGLDNVISVASLNIDKGFSFYSNYGSSLVDIAARGRDVDSALPGGGYGLQSGTSMAAGFVSAAAGLVLSENGDLTAAELKERLCETGDRMAHLQNKVRDGRSLEVEQALSGEPQNALVYIYPEEDFDVQGYAPTPEETWQLYSGSGPTAQVAAGYDCSLALKEDGTVWAWGANSYGQCGNGQTSTSCSLTQVIGLTDVVSIAAGDYHSLAVKSDGTVWAWGANGYGELGDGSTTDRSTPVQVSGLTGVKSVAGGGSHSLALKEDGTVWAWGYNKWGQLGDGSYTTRTIPVQVNWLTGIKSIAAGSWHSLALKIDGTVWAWGYDWAGQLGDGISGNGTEEPAPVQVSGLTGVTSVAAGGDHSLAVKSDGTAWVWGDEGELGGDSFTGHAVPPIDYTGIPEQVSGLTGVKSVVTGLCYSLALKTDGTVWAWGDGWNGLLRDGISPAQVSGLTGVASVAGGGFHSLALKEDSTVWAWGYNYYGQLGDGTTTSSLIPVQCQVYLPPILPPTLSSLSFLNGSYTAAIPGSVTVSAAAYDAGGNEIPDAAITYSLQSAYTGVSINSATGMVTISSGAQPGMVPITASCGQLTANVELELIDGAAVPNQIIINTVANKQYDVTISASHISSFSGVEVKLNYDAAALVPVDLSAFTKGTELTTGQISAAGITITKVNSGEITFTIDKNIAAGKTWSGVLNIIRFKALQSKPATVAVTGLTPAPAMPASIAFIQSAYSTALPASGSTTTTVTAQVKDQNGSVMSGISPTYSIQGTYTGVSMNSTTGVVTIQSGAVAGTVNILASYGTLTSANATLILSGAVSTPTSIAFTKSSYSATVPASGSTTVTVTAQVKDQSGTVMSGINPTYSIQGAYTGVSINSATGVVTIQSSTAAGTVNISASYGTLTGASATLILSPAPTPTSIAFAKSSYSANIPTSGSTTITVTAQVKDQSGTVMSGINPTYSIQGAYTGVSINSATGVVTIQSSAAGGTVNIQASYGTLTGASVTLVLSATPVPTSIVFTPSSYSATIPKNGNTSITVTAQVKDQFGNVMSGYSISYSIVGTYAGVSVNSSNAKVTVTSSAAAGTATIQASYGSLSATAPIVLTK